MTGEWVGVPDVWPDDDAEWIATPWVDVVSSKCRLTSYFTEDKGNGDPLYPSMMSVSLYCMNRRPWHRLRHRLHRLLG